MYFEAKRICIVCDFACIDLVWNMGDIEITTKAMNVTNVHIVLDGP